MATEQDWLSSLGITDPATQTSIISGTTRLLILDASAHMDWDWLLPFPVLTNYDGPSSNPQYCDGQQSRSFWYFHAPSGTDPGVGPVTQILDTVGALLTDPSYRYSVCETGFLRGYALTNPAGFQTLLANGGGGMNGRLQSEGGGITSPDNLLPHGEAFIRDYLMGHAWLAANAPQMPGGATLWIPDDFGHDPQLPILAQAMGMIAAGFERVPGTDIPNPLNGGPSLKDTLNANKIDFLWTADDSSQIAGHFLTGGYGQGNNISAPSDIAGYLAANATASPTPYIYVPVLSDFSLPNKNLAPVVAAWNKAPIAPYQNVIAVCGSFEVFAQLAAFHKIQMVTTYGAPFNANPFWTGCYGTRPAIKIRHQRAVRALLAAEALSLIATWGQPGGGSAAIGTGGAYPQQLAEAWNIVLPSTHHDFITGTAIPDVFHTEQMSLLRQADARAAWLLDDMLRTIAGAIQPPTTFHGQAVAVFNTLGFARGGVVELTAEQVRDASVSLPATGAQATPGGGLLFTATAPSLGYQTIDLSALIPPANQATASLTTNAAVLTNGIIAVTLTPGVKGVWGLTSVVDVAAKYDIVPPGAVLNDLLFYGDDGDEYRFGPERPSPFTSPWTLADVSAYLSNPTIAVIEQGPLRATVRTAMTYNDGTNPPIEFVREYILHANEPMLRMRTTGAAPVSIPTLSMSGVSVLVAFPLSPTSLLDSLQRGTPSHWTGIMPPLYWNDQTFMPTHNFAIPGVGTEMACAIYHADVPAWGLSNRAVGDTSNSDGRVLYGCLWRNGSGQYFGWVCQAPNLPLGSDPDVHVREYALRLPVTQANWPATGQPLQESLAFASPLFGMTVAPLSGQMAPTMSLAASAQSSAVVSVAKAGTVDPGNVILRVYQPTNGALPITLTLAPNLAPSGGASIVVQGQTALEKPLGAADEARLNLKSTPTTVSFTAPRALTTLAITP